MENGLLVFMLVGWVVSGVPIAIWVNRRWPSQSRVRLTAGVYVPGKAFFAFCAWLYIFGGIVALIAYIVKH